MNHKFKKLLVFVQLLILKELGIPSNRDDIIIALKNNNILSSNMAEKVKGLKGFRNFLVHRYGKINDELLLKILNKGFLILHYLKKRY